MKTLIFSTTLLAAALGACASAPRPVEEQPAPAAPPVAETRASEDDAFRGLEREEARAEKREREDNHDDQPSEPETPLR